MGWSRTTLVASLLAAFAQLATLAAGDQGGERAGIAGRWATEGFGAIIDLQRCEAHGGTQRICGRILWLWDAMDSEGRPRVDEENPEARARALPLVGALVLRNFHETSPGVWTGGSVYNPEDGRTYSGTLELRPEGVLELEGCAFRFFCARTVWRRPADLLELAGMR